MLPETFYMAGPTGLSARHLPLKLTRCEHLRELSLHEPAVRGSSLFAGSNRKRACPYKKTHRKDESFYMAGPTGFEPAISSVTGRRVRPLHHEPMVGLKQIG